MTSAPTPSHHSANAQATVATPLRRRDIIFLGCAIVIAFAALSPAVISSDTWWQMAYGHLALTHGIPSHEPLSFLPTLAAFSTTQWLYDILVYWLHSWGGWFLPLLLMSGLVVVGLAVTVTLHILPDLPSPMSVRAIALVVGALLLSPYVGVTQDALLALATSLMCLCLASWAAGNAKAPLWLIPLSVSWVNLAPGFVILPLTCTAVLVATAIAGLRKGAASRDDRFLLVAILLSLLAPLLTVAHGQQYGSFFASLEGNQLPSLVSQWASPNFHLWPPRFVELVAMGVVALWVRSAKPRLDDVVLTLALIVMTFYVSGAMVALIVVLTRQLALYGGAAARSLPQWAWVSHITPATTRLAPAVAALVALLSLGVTADHLGTGTAQNAVATTYPTTAAAWVNSHLDNVHVYAPYSWGGYLAWTLPAREVGLYGNTGAFSHHTITSVEKVTTIRQGWEGSVALLGMTAAVVPSTTANATIFDTLGWDEVCVDPQAAAAVFVNPKVQAAQSHHFATSHTPPQC